MALQAGSEMGAERASEMLVIGKDRASLGPPAPLLKSLGLGFALGLVAMAVVTLLAR